MLTTLLDIVHVFVCLFLMLVVLLQQGKGGGMGAAFGGGATRRCSAGAARATSSRAPRRSAPAIFMLTSVSLAYVSSSGDRELKARIVEEQRKGKGNEGTRIKAPKPKPCSAGHLTRHGPRRRWRDVRRRTARPP